MNGCSKVTFDNPKHLNIIQTTSLQLFPHLLSIPCFPLQHTNLSHSLREVDLSFCGLSQGIDEIGSLRQLEMLNLEGNNFVTLPSLNELSKLVYLNLNNSKLLEYLPQLPFPTTIKMDPFPSDYEFIGLHFFNCPKLCERQCRMAALSWMTQFIQTNPHNISDAIDIVIPGSKIPSWFNNQSEGDRILIDNSLIKHDINNDIIGFVCCSVSSIEARSKPLWSEVKIYMELQLSGLALGTIRRPPFICDGNLITAKTNHIWLTYYPRKLSWNPDFHDSMKVRFDVFNAGAMEVMNCGYGWLHKQGLQEFNLTKTHPATRKRKILAIEDDAQKQQQQPKDYIHSSE